MKTKLDKNIQQQIHHFLITVHNTSEALLTQYREDVPRLNHQMALEDIEKAQYYLEQAKQKIMEASKNENVNNTPTQPEAKPDNDLNKDEVE
ncbi:MAG TPA: hypothetical protein VMR70_11495 [Flavisolibacter sp.]|nr:hypothetical protein [Flavisolibacter sp.]